jgi:4-oxalocrotonate tautomerase
MPVVNFHLVRGLASAEQERRLLLDGAAVLAAAVGSPIERVRSFTLWHEPESWAMSGQRSADSGLAQPYFELTLMRGRPPEVRHRVLAHLTELIAEVLCVPAAVVRGCIRQIEPDDWSIGGVPASVLRPAAPPPQPVPAAD